MSIFLGSLAGLAVFYGTVFGVSVVMGMMGNWHQLFRLLFFVQPYRAVSRWLLFICSAWLGISAFVAVA